MQAKDIFNISYMKKRLHHIKREKTLCKAREKFQKLLNEYYYVSPLKEENFGTIFERTLNHGDI